MIRLNHDAKQSQIRISTKDRSRTWTNSKCSRNYFHLIKMLILIISISFFVKPLCAVKWFGSWGKPPANDISNEAKKTPKNNVEMKNGRTTSQSVSIEKKLTSELIQRYDNIGKVGRPIAHTKEAIDIYFALSLIQIMDVDESNQILKLSLWYRFEWTDVFLRWRPSRYGGIQSIHLPSDRIWLPDIRLYNFADERLNEQRDALIVVDSNGSIQWAPQAILKSSCAFDTKYFPFDVQHCRLKFGSWTYTLKTLNMEFVGAKRFHLYDYIENNEWNIVGNNATRHVQHYMCCPESFPDLTYDLILKRKTAFYTYILILPCTLLALLTLVIFWVPPESPAKLQLGMSVFIAFFFLLMVLSEFVPRAAPTIPLIGAYFCLNMVMITVSSVLACVVSNMYFRGIRIQRAPACLRWVIGSRLAHYVRLDSPKPLIFDEISVRNSISDKVPVLLSEIDIPRNDDQDQNVNQQNQYPLNNNDSLVNIDIDQGYQTPYLLLLEEVRAVRCSLDRADLNYRQKDERNKVIREWQILASIADRIFFIVYVIINTITLMCMLTVL